jgi:hypothetical protein
VNEFERLWVRRRFVPVVPPPDADPGEDVERAPTSGAQLEYVAEHGALEPGETFPEHLEIDHGRRPAYSALERASWRWWPTEVELAEQLEREQREADRSHAEGAPRHEKEER